MKSAYRNYACPRLILTANAAVGGFKRPVYFLSPHRPLRARFNIIFRGLQQRYDIQDSQQLQQLYANPKYLNRLEASLKRDSSLYLQVKRSEGKDMESNQKTIGRRRRTALD